MLTKKDYLLLVRVLNKVKDQVCDLKNFNSVGAPGAIAAIRMIEDELMVELARDNPHFKEAVFRKALGRKLKG